MQLGELFFSLGFKNSGTAEVKQFESAIDSSQQVVQLMSDAVEHLVFLLEEMAIKMGAVTRADINANKELMSETKNISEAPKASEKITEKKDITSVTALTEKDTIAKTKQSGILGTLNNKMKSWWGNLAAARIQILAISGVMTAFTKKISDVAVNIDKISTLTGLSNNSVQRMGDMAAQTGANVDDLAGAVQSFQKQSVDIMLGKGGNIGTFQFLGINPHEDPLKILDQLSKKLKTMPTALGTSMAKDLGLSDDLIYFLKNTDNLRPISEETIITDKEIERLKAFNFNFNRVWEMGKRTLTKFGAAISPIMNQVTYFFERISLMFSGLINKIEPYLGKIMKWMPLVVTLGAIMFAAFFPVTAAVLLLLAAFEDIYTYMHGGDSLFGSMVKWLGDIKERLRDVIKWSLFLGNIFTGGNFDEQFQNMLNSVDNKFDEMKSKEKVIGEGTVLAATAGSKTSTQDYSTQVLNFNIDGAKDPSAVGDEVLSRFAQGAYWNRNASDLGVAQPNNGTYGRNR